MTIHGYGVDLSALFCINDSRYLLTERADFEPFAKLFRKHFPADVAGNFLDELDAAQGTIGTGKHLLQVGEHIAQGIMGGEAEGTGLSLLLSIALFQERGIQMQALKDIDGSEYIIFVKRFPWEMNMNERLMLQSDLRDALTKYLRNFTRDNIAFQEFDIEVNIAPGTG